MTDQSSCDPTHHHGGSRITKHSSDTVLKFKVATSEAQIVFDMQYLRL